MKTKLYALMDKNHKIVQKGSNRRFFLGFIDDNRHGAKWVVYPTRQSAEDNLYGGDPSKVRKYLDENYRIVWHKKYKDMIDWDKSDYFLEIVELDTEF